MTIGYAGTDTERTAEEDKGFRTEVAESARRKRLG